jgi:hypothetical protein
MTVADATKGPMRRRKAACTRGRSRVAGACQITDGCSPGSLERRDERAALSPTEARSHIAEDRAGRRGWSITCAAALLQRNTDVVGVPRVERGYFGLEGSRPTGEPGRRSAWPVTSIRRSGMSLDRPEGRSWWRLVAPGLACAFVSWSLVGVGRT